MLPDFRLQNFYIIFALAAADDFAIPFRRENIDTQGTIGTFRIGFHIKCFDRRGITVYHQWFIELLREISFVGAAEIIAGNEWRRFLLFGKCHCFWRREHRRRFVVT